MSTFAADVSRWSEKAKRNATLVLKQSAQEVAEELSRPVAKGGRMRVDTGFLRSSLTTTLNTPTPMNPNAKAPSDAPPGSFTLNLVGTSTAIAAADLGDTIFMTFTASYARHREEKDMFVRTAAMRWQQIVDEVAARVK